MASRRSGASSATVSSIDPERLPVFGVVLAGGSGTRLWPVARRTAPKQFLPMFKGRSLFRMACDRAAAIAGRRNVMVVTAASHVGWVRRQAPGISRRRIIAEEIGRNTAAAIGLAALRIRAECNDGIMVVLPADHWIEPPRAFRAAVQRAIAAARLRRRLVLIGISPRTADPGFGYIRPGRASPAPGARAVVGFVEKPGARRAARMMASRRYLWNSGIFVWGASDILRELEQHAPRVIRPAGRWARTAGHGAWKVPAPVMRRIQEIPIDRAVLERSRNLLVVRGDFAWSDLGNWSALADVLVRGPHRNGGIGRSLFIDASGCCVVNSGGLSVLVGVRDLVAVREGDVMLVCNRSAAQQVRDVVARLRGTLRTYL